MKWIKASEGLPDMETFLYIKDNVSCKRMGNFFKDGDKTRLSICGTEMYQSFTVEEDYFNNYFWLDESPDSKDAEGLDEKEFIKMWGTNNERIIPYLKSKYTITKKQ